MSLNIDILTVLPELLDSPFGHSMVKRAREKGLLDIRVHQLRQWAVNEYGQVDDYQYGGGAGMVMMPEPLAAAIESLSKERLYDEIIYLTPDGRRMDQRIANGLSLKGNRRAYPGKICHDGTVYWRLCAQRRRTGGGGIGGRDRQADSRRPQ